MNYRYFAISLLLSFVGGCASEPKKPTVAEQPDLALVRIERPGAGGTSSGATFTGFFVTGNGTIVTAAPVAEGEAPLEIVTHDGHAFSADRIEVDREDEVAILAVHEKDLPFLPLEEEDVEPGLAVRVVSQGGIVRGVFDHWEDLGKTLALTMRTSPADVGAPVLSDEGKVVAVVIGPLPEHADQTLAMPVWHVVRMMPSVMRGG